MATTLPAMRGRFGSTDYFLVTMPAKELSEKLVIPKEMEGWDELTIEERFQRDVDYKRVKEHMAPYLASDPDRFFGAFIVSMHSADEVNFEPIGDVVQGLPALYKQTVKFFGFLTLSGSEVLVPLDGQHRLAAIKFAISGKDEKQKDIPNITPNLEIAHDQCVVILVKQDVKKDRKIFNKVNRYAKATSKSDNLITADDDIIAIIAREEISAEVLQQRLVNFESNTLSPKAPEFTTLSTVYETTASILEDLFGKIDRGELPSSAKQKLYREHASSIWQKILDKVDIFSNAIIDPTEGGDDKRREIRKDYTLGKPIVQQALIEAAVRVMHADANGAAVSPEEVCKRINKVDWKANNSLWQNVLMRGDKVVAGKQAQKFAARFIAYYIGEKLEPKDLATLEQQYASHFDASLGSPKKLPAPLS